MKSIVPVARLLISVFGITLVVLGTLFWTGHEYSLIPVHKAIGLLFVICLWALAARGFATPKARVFALVVLIWSLIVPALGMAQFTLLPGPEHWVIKVIHLLVGLIAMGLGHGLARRIGQRPAEAAAATEGA